MKLTDLYFGYMNYDQDTGELKEHNLFGIYSVLHSVAKWVTMKPQKRKELHSDCLHYCFFDVCGKCEFEFVVEAWFGNGEKQKVDIWSMYVAPNARLLEDMVSKVSVNSAREWLKKNKK